MTRRGGSCSSSGHPGDLCEPTVFSFRPYSFLHIHSCISSLIHPFIPFFSLPLCHLLSSALCQRLFHLPNGGVVPFSFFLLFWANTGSCCSGQFPPRVSSSSSSSLLTSGALIDTPAAIKLHHRFVVADGMLSLAVCPRERDLKRHMILMI